MFIDSYNYNALVAHQAHNAMTYHKIVGYRKAIYYKNQHKHYNHTNKHMRKKLIKKMAL